MGLIEDDIKDDVESSHSSNGSSSVACGPAFNRIKERIAGRLRATAEKLPFQDSLASSGTEWAKLVSQTQGWMNMAADRVEHIDPVKVKMDFERSVRRQPGKSLLIAGVAGLLLGIVLRRR